MWLFLELTEKYRSELIVRILIKISTILYHVNVTYGNNAYYKYHLIFIFN
jgi:hypothetical protein